MTQKTFHIKPAVNKSVLLFLAAFMWIGVGVMLLSLAYAWLHQHVGIGPATLATIGVVMALVIHHFGFLRVVDKNLARILPMNGKICIFGFISWKSYILVAVMITMGLLLRHSAIPKPYLAVLYVAIGLALILSSVRYVRYLVRQCKQTEHLNGSSARRS